MTRSEFRELYRQSLFEASDKWPDSFHVNWKEVSKTKLEGWLNTVMGEIPRNGVTLTTPRSGFTILAQKLGIRQTAKGVREALAACTPDPTEGGGQ